MTSGKCPHPWNATKKGTFQKGHSQVNKGLGQFEKGHKIKEEYKEAVRKRGQEAYQEGTHPFLERNERMKGNTTYWYGISHRRWTELAKTIRERDDHTCQSCGKKDLGSKKGHAHHIIPFKWSRDNSPSNLSTLCDSCHTKIEWLIQDHLVELFHYIPRLPTSAFKRSERGEVVSGG